MDKLTIKTEAEIEIMSEGGRKLRKIRDSIVNIVKAGMSTADLDREAERLVVEAGGKF